MAVVGRIDGPLVEPTAGQQGWRIALLTEQFGQCGVVALQAASGVAGEDLGVELLHHAETAELAFNAVPVAVVVSILGGQRAAGEFVADLDAFDHLNREWQCAAPACGGRGLVAQKELRRRHIAHLGDGTEVVVHAVQQVGLVAASQVEEEVRGSAAAVGIARPQDAGDARTEQVRQPHADYGVDRRRAADRAGRAPTVAGSVDPERDFAVRHVEEVSDAVAIDITEQHALGVEVEWQHAGDLGGDALTPTSVAQIGPVVDAALIDDGDVLQAIARQVRKLDARVCKADVGKGVKPLARDARSALRRPALGRVVEKALEGSS